MDTNVLVYATQLTSPIRDAARQALNRSAKNEARLCLSRQVLREYLAVVTRPQLFAHPVSMPDALADLVRFAKDFDILEDGPAVTAQLVQLCQTAAGAGRQVHDANFVATMLAHGERRLLTANRSDFSRFGPRIEIVEP